MVGASGGELGIRGFIAAFDARDRARRCGGPTRSRARASPATTPGRGEHWKTGGVLGVAHRALRSPAQPRATGAPATAAPWPGDMRPGDNLYSSSVIALDPDTGKIRGHHQYHWNDSWDWDEVSTPLLIDVAAGRRARSRAWCIRAAMATSGCWSAAPTASSSSTPSRLSTRKSSRDRSDDRAPELRPRAEAAAPASTVTFCPGLWGGKDWPPAAYNPKTGLLYIPANENLCSTLVGQPKPTVRARQALPRDRSAEDHDMSIAAGRQPHRRATGLGHDDRPEGLDAQVPVQNWGPVLTTGGGLVFLGGTNDRNFRAFDAKTGNGSGSSRPTPASRACRAPTRSTASSTSPCSRAGASTRSGCRPGSTRSAAPRPRSLRAA